MCVLYLFFDYLCVRDSFWYPCVCICAYLFEYIHVCAYLSLIIFIFVCISLIIFIFVYLWSSWCVIVFVSWCVIVGEQKLYEPEDPVTLHYVPLRKVREHIEEAHFRDAKTFAALSQFLILQVRVMWMWLCDPMHLYQNVHTRSCAPDYWLLSLEKEFPNPRRGVTSQENKILYNGRNCRNCAHLCTSSLLRKTGRL